MAAAHVQHHARPLWLQLACQDFESLEETEGMDHVYVQYYFNEIKVLGGVKSPIRPFVEVWMRKGYSGMPGEIDWWHEFDLRND